MNESLIIELIPNRMMQMGYQKYHIRHKDLVVDENSTLSISAYNSLWFVIGNPLGITIESDYGMYDTLKNEVSENIHIHRGEIAIYNPDNEKRRVSFVEAIILS